MQWQPGDFIISDNLAVAHEASPQTQMTVSDVGLRIMHRTTIAGQHHLHKELQLWSSGCTDTAKALVRLHSSTAETAIEVHVRRS